ncbi:MAG: (deoxy)nucleoside triphosphate pyrophosphohydrolase [Polyangiaceae bacterium]
METVLVAAAIVIEHGRVLVTQRKAGTHLGGSWELPGGKVASGEDPRDALRRELNEELGIDILAGEIVDVAFHRYEDAHKSVLLLFFEAARTAASSPPAAVDVAAYAWATADDLDRLTFPPADVAVLRKVKAILAPERSPKGFCKT